MKTFKNIIFAALTLVCCFCASPLLAQTPPSPCVPPTVTCDACVCTLTPPSGCTEKAYWLEVVTTSPNCHLVVEFRIRTCVGGNCDLSYCQISIDKIYPFAGSCESCSIVTAADLKEAMEQTQAYILSHLYEICDPGYVPDRNNPYNYIVWFS